MTSCFTSASHPTLLAMPALALMLALSGCTVGPDYQKPQVNHPADWSAWRSGDASLHQLPGSDAQINVRWWESYHDPILNQLVTKALSASPDLKTAALNFAAARAQGSQTSAAQLPEVTLSGKVSREKISEKGSSTRLISEVYSGTNADSLLDMFGQPYSWYQSGVDFSWEIDLWGHVRRAVEAAGADTEAQKALLAQAQLSIISDVVTNYYTLRDIQQQIVLAKEDERSMDERLALIRAQTQGGSLDYSALERQQAELAATRAKQVDLRQQEGQTINQILLLLGERPGELQKELGPQYNSAGQTALPALNAGLPSQVAINRPDIRSAEAKLHAATARIGVAKAELYPSITLGGRFGYDTWKGSDFGQWGTRTWSIGPSLDLPLFDYGKRKSVVVLREVEQQQAAVDFHKTVLKAWQEIDDALNRYTAAQQKLHQQQQQVKSAEEALSIDDARYKGGMTDFINVLDSQRSAIQARTALVDSESEVRKAFAAVNRATGNYPR